MCPWCVEGVFLGAAQLSITQHPSFSNVHCAHSGPLGQVGREMAIGLDFVRYEAGRGVQARPWAAHMLRVVCGARALMQARPARNDIFHRIDTEASSLKSWSVFCESLPRAQAGSMTMFRSGATTTPRRRNSEHYADGVSLCPPCGRNDVPPAYTTSSRSAPPSTTSGAA